MKKCVIFCAGGFDTLLEPLAQADFLIAADGGLVHTRKLGVTPDLILGDFDSLGYVPQGAQVHPVEKDDTDAMLAVREGLKQGCDTFLLYGSLDGERLDHTVANYQTLQFLADRGCRGYLVGVNQIATVMKDGTLEFPPGSRGYVSVFCSGAEAMGVSIKGLQYEMDSSTLSPGFPLGVSNRFVGEKSEISVEKGSLLVIWQREKS